MFARLNGIWIERTDGMPCKWEGICAKRSSYNLDDDGEGEVSDLNLCTQHAKIMMERVTGGRVMAKDLERAVERERDFAETALQAFSSGWDAAVEAMTPGPSRPEGTPHGDLGR